MVFGQNGKKRMNERIRELAKEATVLEDDELFVREVFDKEKFAELIVRECAAIALHEDHDPSDCILKHFGVEG